ncbi:MAG: transposase [Defluviitaleaceae bacterium]|nr:transposase [Defluviitaleaceae bacterium]
MNGELLKECITHIVELANEAKNEMNSPFRDGKLLAYNEVLSSLKTNLVPLNPEEFGLGFDIDKEFA